jgi:phosphate starvation-inducible protein PhoH
LKAATEKRNAELRGLLGEKENELNALQARLDVVIETRNRMDKANQLLGSERDYYETALSERSQELVACSSVMRIGQENLEFSISESLVPVIHTPDAVCVLK